MKTILVPIDGSECSERAVLKAKELADCLGSKIILLNIINVVVIVSDYVNPRYSALNSSTGWPNFLDEARKKSGEIMEESKQLLPGLDVETVILEEPSGNFAETIVDFAKERDVDIIVMGSNGMGSLRHRLYLGSVTTRVLHTTEKPVLVIQ